MKQKKLPFLSALCAALTISQIHGAAEAQADRQKAWGPDYFDVKAFVAKVETGELIEDQIRENLNRQNPPHHDMWGKANWGYSTNTPAIQAACTNSTQALATFIRLGANLEKINRANFTALMAAAEQDHQEAVTMLVQAGAALNFQGEEGCTALICAAKRRQLATTCALIKAGAELDIQDNYKQTALIKAIQGSYASPLVVSALLQEKADTSVVDQYGKTAYIHAIDPIYYPKGPGAIAQMLVKAGAQPEKEIEAVKNAPFRIGLLARIPVPAESKSEYDGESVALPAESQNPELENGEAEIIDADAQEI